MSYLTYATVSASLSELKKNPIATVSAGEGQTVAIFKRNLPVFYCVPAAAYEALMDRLEDMELNAIADARHAEPVIQVTLDAL